MPIRSSDLAPGMQVVCTDGPIGTVGHIDVDQPTGGLVGFILHLGPTAREEVFVPSDWIARVEPGQVVLLVARAEVVRAAEPRREGTVP